MKNIAIAGSGNIGSLIAMQLAHTNMYRVIVFDKDFHHADSQRLRGIDNIECLVADITDTAFMDDFFSRHTIHAIISCLPYFCNLQIAHYAHKYHFHYFDLTEDIEVAEKIKILSQDASTVFMPRCGLAPGFIGLVANHLSRDYDQLRSVKLRVGALPINSNNALQYALTWSTEGLINEYANPSEIIENGQVTWVPALEGLETIQIDGMTYEAFNTSGGVGNLVDVLEGQVDNLSYKTIRYPTHCEKIKFLMNDLLLERDRPTLKAILEKAIPKTYQDVVIVYVAITGYQDGHFIESNYVKKIYPKNLYTYHWSAMQVTTASSVSAVVDIILQDETSYRGYCCQENISFDTFIQNQFGMNFV
jgi:saccharopine dehydrogenase-like NADP-dependent oxidoreductase